MNPTATMTTRAIPHFIFIARSPALLDAWRAAIARYFPPSTAPNVPADGHAQEPGLGREQAEEQGQAQGHTRDQTQGLAPDPGRAGHGLFSVHAGALGDVPAEAVAHECVVSPANAFGIMDGEIGRAHV